VQLYNAFPRRTTVYAEDIYGPDSTDDYGIQSPRHRAFFSALRWLADEGYLRYEDTIRQEALDQAVLTHKAFILLNTPIPVSPDAGLLAERVSHIQRLRQPIATGSSRVLGEALSDFLTAPTR